MPEDRAPSNPFAGRTFVRTQGCWNCIHFQTGENAKKVWEDHKRKLLVTLAQRGGLSLTKDPFAGTIVETMEEKILSGRQGLCLTGKAEADFVSHKYLCPSGWSARQGASLASSGRPDKEIGEILEIADARAKPVS